MILSSAPPGGAALPGSRSFVEASAPVRLRCRQAAEGCDAPSWEHGSGKSPTWSSPLSSLSVEQTWRRDLSPHHGGAVNVDEVMDSVLRNVDSSIEEAWGKPAPTPQERSIARPAHQRRPEGDPRPYQPAGGAEGEGYGRADVSTGHTPEAGDVPMLCTRQGTGLSDRPAHLRRPRWLK